MALKSSKAGAHFQKTAGSLFARLPFSANQITVFSLLLALVGFFFAYARSPLLSLLFFILSGAADAIDGAVARAKKEVSARGAYIDGIMDRLVEFLLLLSLAMFTLPTIIAPALVWLVLILFFGTCMTSFATAYADHRKAADALKIARQPGILPRAERLLLLFAALALAPLLPLASSAILLAAAALSFITFAQRAAYFAM